MLFRHLFVLFAAIYSAFSFLATLLSQLCFVEELLSKVSAVRSGAEDLVGMSKQRYMDRLTWVRQLMRFNLSNWTDRKNFERVSQTLEVLRLDDSNGSIRKQPYCILLTGYPGCGKSSYALQLATACLRKRYGIAHSNDIVTLNETDEFQSEYRSSHKVVIFDDVGAEVYTINTTNPWRKVIDFVNNIRKTSLNPNVEMKGNVYIQPDLVIITTNLSDDFHVSSYMNSPDAIYRRLNKMLYLEPDFVTAKVMCQNKTNDKIEGWAYSTYSKPMVAGLLTERSSLIQSISSDFCRHLDEQQRFVDVTNNNFDVVVSKTAWGSFFSDVVEPNLPRKIPLSEDQEKLLPFYHRWWRAICVDNNSMPICMSSDAGYSDNQYVREAQEKISVHENYHVFQQFLLANVDWQFFEVIREFMIQETHLTLYQGIISGATTKYSRHYVLDKPGELANMYGIPCTLKDLDLAYQLYKNTNPPSSVVTSEDDDSFMPELSGSTSSIDVEKLNSPSEAICAVGKSDPPCLDWGSCSTSTSIEPYINQFISDCMVPDKWLRKYPCDLSRPSDPNIEQVISTAPMSLDLVGYEMKIANRRIDLVFRLTGIKRLTYIVVEVKSSASINKALTQARSYKIALSSEGLPRGAALYAMAFNSETCISDPIGFKNKKHNPDKKRFASIVGIWKKEYIDRCGAVEPGVDSSDHRSLS